jgi:hypothetical protein
MMLMSKSVSTTRLRIGIIVWVFSYLPFPFVLLYIEQQNGNYTTTEEASQFLAVCYAIQFGIGFIGLFIAGKEAIKMVKSDGWKAAPKKVWQVVIHGKFKDNEAKTSE